MTSAGTSPTAQFPSPDSLQFFFRLDQQKMVRRLQLQPLPQARPQHGQRHSEFSRRAEQPGNHLIECESRRGRHLRLAGPHLDSAAVAELHPPLPLELAIPRADGIGMQMKQTPVHAWRAGPDPVADRRSEFRARPASPVVGGSRLRSHGRTRVAWREHHMRRPFAKETCPRFVSSRIAAFPRPAV